ncbi:MAG TPA: sulfatase-like hydrolase/transferase [Steroidobacteraceae bacterium]|nr:sulfatase-like hydrolase/transferase [Steroidobacteraceae bacterium]
MNEPAASGSAIGGLRARLAALRAEGIVLLAAMFMVVGAVGVWVKLAQLSQSTGYLAISRFLGYSHESQFAWWQKLSFLRLDLMIQGFALPVGLALLLRALPRALRVPSAAVVAILLCTFYYFQLQSLGSIGRYLTPDLIQDAIFWAIDFPEAIGEYASPRGALKLLAAVTVIVVLAVAAARRSRGVGAGGLVRTIEIGTLAVLAGSLVLALIAAAAPVPSLAPHRSALRTMVQAMLPQGGAYDIPRHASREELLALFRRAARQTEGSSPAVTAGLDAGHDVILFIMETGPARSYDPIGDRDSLPGVSMLLDRAFVGRHHLTTYPYTSDAIFSILTGMYPIGRGPFLRKAQSLSGAGLVPPLAARGYSGAVYLPYPDSFENDTAMYAISGVSKTYVADPKEAQRFAQAAQRAQRTIEALPADSPARRERAALLADRLTHDLMALDAMLTDIVASKQAGERFVTLFVPQIGHAPWFDLYGRESVVERGRDVMILQDAWLAEIVTRLAEGDWLDDTVIVVTADHGVRTRVEDPGLPSGTITDYSFEVPLVIFAPGTLTAMREVTARTSHVDIAPTVHALLGAGGDGTLSQGVPIWDEAALAERRVFMFAAGYLGADAYAEDGRYVVRRWLNGFVHESTTLPVGAGTMVTQPEAASRLAEPIDLMYALQPALLEVLHSDAPP